MLKIIIPEDLDKKRILNYNALNLVELGHGEVAVRPSDRIQWSKATDLSGHSTGLPRRMTG